MPPGGEVALTPTSARCPGLRCWPPCCRRLTTAGAHIRHAGGADSSTDPARLTWTHARRREQGRLGLVAPVVAPGGPGVRILFLNWSPLTESNRRPSPYHGDALPTELRGPARAIVLPVLLAARDTWAGRPPHHITALESIHETGPTPTTRAPLHPVPLPRPPRLPPGTRPAPQATPGQQRAQSSVPGARSDIIEAEGPRPAADGLPAAAGSPERTPPTRERLAHPPGAVEGGPAQPARGRSRPAIPAANPRPVEKLSALLTEPGAARQPN